MLFDDARYVWRGKIAEFRFEKNCLSEYADDDLNEKKPSCGFGNFLKSKLNAVEEYCSAARRNATIASRVHPPLCKRSSVSCNAAL